MKRFNAKLLLFGEYGLLYGADALAVPFPKFGGSLNFNLKCEDESINASQLEIKKFVSMFEASNLNNKMLFQLHLEQLNKELGEGLYFDSDIPIQYGLGSSGALCAAIFDRYSTFQKNKSETINKNFLQELKHDFALLESNFHGRSSGIDPLVSYLNRPVLFTPENIQLPEIKNQKGNFSAFLIDTEMKSSTAPLVSLFNKKMDSTKFKNLFQNYFLPANNLAIRAFLESNSEELFLHFERLSGFQSKYFSEMIPESFRDFFKNSVKNKAPVKLLGSGGGGFLLALNKREPSLPAKINSLKVF